MLLETISAPRPPERPQVLVSAGGVSYYSDRGEENITEASTKGEGFIADVCEAWEAEAMKAKQLGLRVVCLRIGIVLGPKDGALGSLASLGICGPIGTGQQCWP